MMKDPSRFIIVVKLLLYLLEAIIALDTMCVMYDVDIIVFLSVIKRYKRGLLGAGHTYWNRKPC